MYASLSLYSYIVWMGISVLLACYPQRPIASCLCILSCTSGHLATLVSTLKKLLWKKVWKGLWRTLPGALWWGYWRARLRLWRACECMHCCVCVCGACLSASMSEYSISMYMYIYVGSQGVSKPFTCIQRRNHYTDLEYSNRLFHFIVSFKIAA